MMFGFSRDVDLARFEPGVFGSWVLSQRLGLRPGDASAEYDVADIINAESLRAASVFGVLAMIFQALYSGAEGQAVLREKAETYQWLTDEAMGRVAVKVDTDGDGDGDKLVEPGVICLIRK